MQICALLVNNMKVGLPKTIAHGLPFAAIVRSFATIHSQVGCSPCSKRGGGLLIMLLLHLVNITTSIHVVRHKVTQVQL